MKLDTLQAMFDMECSYNLAKVSRECAMQAQATRYELAFEKALVSREERRRQDREQWLNVILPSIQKRAMLSHMA